MGTKGDDSRLFILDRALELFISRGFHGVSISEISEACGLTKGALYHHFQNKDDLYRQAVAWYFDRKIEKVCVRPWHDRPELGLTALVAEGFAQLARSKDFIRGLAGGGDDAILRFYAFLYEATRRYPEFQKRIDEGDERTHRNLTARFREAQGRSEIRSDLDPDLLAAELDMLLQQLQYLSFVNPGLRDDPSRIPALRDSFLLKLKESRR